MTQLKQYQELFCCPNCGGSLIVGKIINCRDCQTQFPVTKGIPRMFWPKTKLDSITSKVKYFYEGTPFPDYEGLETVADLLAKATSANFARYLEGLIPFNSLVLEAGCGTGQLPNYLAIAHRFVFGTDMSLASLRLAEEFRQRNQLERVGFYQMNLFQPIFKSKSFDAVISTGVLHHTPDPRAGFLSLARLVKPGGIIVIGLYHRWSRWVNRCCRNLGIDPQLARIKSRSKRRAWFEDQYHHPHESAHTVKEVSGWFKQAGVDVLEVLPGSLLQFFLTGVREGGLFIMIGRKK